MRRSPTTSDDKLFNAIFAGSCLAVAVYFALICAALIVGILIAVKYLL